MEEIHLSDYNEFDLREFPKIIETLEKSGLDYFVFGGFAYDGINNESKDHGDLDLVGLIKDRDKLRDLFKQLGYKGYQIGEIRDAFLKGKSKIDLIFMIDCGDCYEISGGLYKEELSKEAFTPRRKVEREGVKFTIMPYEWFKLYENEKFGNKEKTQMLKAIKKIMPLCRKFKIYEHLSIEKRGKWKKIPLN